MDKIYLGTNWKMHKNILESKKYLIKLKEYIKDVNFERVVIFVIPPYTALSTVREELEGSHILYGAQNMHWKTEGAYTGEISPYMLKDFKPDLVELGHSERRKYYNENNIDLNKKVKAAIEFNFTPLICVGEKLKEKKYGTGKEIIRRQLKIILNNIKKEDARKIWIAYEPVWAIGEKGKPARPEYAESIHKVIRNFLKEKYNDVIANRIPVIYGGSVNNKNGNKFLIRKNIDGLFIGRAAWDAKSFSKIIHNTLLTKF